MVLYILLFFLQSCPQSFAGEKAQTKVIHIDAFEQLKDQNFLHTLGQVYIASKFSDTSFSEQTLFIIQAHDHISIQSSLAPVLTYPLPSHHSLTKKIMHGIVNWLILYGNHAVEEKFSQYILDLTSDYDAKNGPPAWNSRERWKRYFIERIFNIIAGEINGSFHGIGFYPPFLETTLLARLFLDTKSWLFQETTAPSMSHATFASLSFLVYGVKGLITYLRGTAQRDLLLHHLYKHFEQQRLSSIFFVVSKKDFKKNHVVLKEWLKNEGFIIKKYQPKAQQNLL